MPNCSSVTASTRAPITIWPGTLSIDEYFLWVLGVCVQQSASGSLDTLFRRYDKNNTGTLDAEEFAHVCTDLNFGQFAHDIFIELVRARANHPPLQLCLSCRSPSRLHFSPLRACLAAQSSTVKPTRRLLRR